MKTSSKFFFTGVSISILSVLSFNLSLVALLPMFFVTLFIWFGISSSEDDGDVKNYGQSTLEEKLKYNTMELILKLFQHTDSKFEGDKEKLTLTFREDTYVIFPSGTVTLNDKKIMIDDSYGKYIFKYIANNWKQIASISNIVKFVPTTQITNDQITLRLESDIRKAIEDTEQINYYMGEIQKIRKQYLDQYEVMGTNSIKQRVQVK